MVAYLRSTASLVVLICMLTFCIALDVIDCDPEGSVRVKRKSSGRLRLQNSAGEGMKCRWRVEPTDRDKKLQLTIKRYETCSDDKLTIYHGLRYSNGILYESEENEMPPMNTPLQTNTYRSYVKFRNSCSHSNLTIDFEVVDATGAGSSESSESSESPGPSNYACVSPPKSNHRIVGGHEAADHAYPSAVILTDTDMKYKPFCGGTVIDKEWVVTAAHCLPWYRSRYSVFAGVHDRTDGITSQVQVRSASRVFKHPNYSSWSYANDIALIKLSSPLTWTDQVQPACLSDQEMHAGATCTAVGWGTMSNGHQSNTPQVVQVPLVSQSDCRKAYPYYIQNTNICAGATGKDSCQGDSGGPLYAIENNYQVLVGVVNWGRGCGQEGYPGVYARVASYHTWIKDTMT